MACLRRLSHCSRCFSRHAGECPVDSAIDPAWPDRPSLAFARLAVLLHEGQSIYRTRRRFLNRGAHLLNGGAGHKLDARSCIEPTGLEAHTISARLPSAPSNQRAVRLASSSRHAGECHTQVTIGRHAGRNAEAQTRIVLRVGSGHPRCLQHPGETGSSLSRTGSGPRP